jgi:hypothetical protein
VRGVSDLKKRDGSDPVSKLKRRARTGLALQGASQPTSTSVTLAVEEKRNILATVVGPRLAGLAGFAGGAVGDGTGAAGSASAALPG